MQVENLKREILLELPQIPFVIDQVGEALKWAEEAYDEAKLIKVLTTSADVAKWVATISEPNFYKTHLVIASLLSDIEGVLENPKFERFDSASKSVENTIKAIIVDEGTITERGCFSALTIHLVQLAQKDEECLALMFKNILSDLKELILGIKEAGVKTPITPQDYITVLGYSLVMANLRMSNLSLLDYNRDIINDISIILNNDVIY